MNIDDNNILGAALLYASLGIPVFPVRTRDKRPLTTHGFKDATTNEAQIRAWWAKTPDANIGIPTGRVSGLVVLDIDPRHGGLESLRKLEEQHGPIDRAVVAWSGGGGLHIYFRAPEGGVSCSVGRIGPGLDVRGDGGYIVAAPSIHESGWVYSWQPEHGLFDSAPGALPEWMLAMARPAHPGGSGAPSRPDAPEDSVLRVERGRRILEGQRHSRLVSFGGSLRRGGLGPAEIGSALTKINEAACEPPLPAEEVERIASSMSAYQPNAGMRSRSFSSACDGLRNPQYLTTVIGGVLEFDEFAGSPTINRQPITDQHIDRIRDNFERTIRFVDKQGQERGIQFSHEEMGRAVHLVARERSFHPVRDYLGQLAWDGVPRISTLLPGWLRIGTDPLAAILVRRWMISAVARPLKPGCKVDSVFTLVGAQGTGKSTFFVIMAGMWFSDTPVNVGDKDAFLALRRIWIMEFAEMEAMARARDANQVKSFLSSTTDKFRPPYGHEVIEVPRSCVIVASTNEEAFLSDPTGNRRYWTVKVTGKIDFDAISLHRDQLWAEAVAAFKAGEPWHLTPDEDAQLGLAQRAFETSDPWEEAVLDYALGVTKGVTVAEILRYALSKQPGFWTKGDELRVSAILKRAKFTRKTFHKERRWMPPAGGAATAATNSIKTTTGSDPRGGEDLPDPDAAAAAPDPKGEE